MSKITNIDKAYKILGGYEGNNPYILTLKRNVEFSKKILSDFEIEFMLKNEAVEPKIINKIVKIADWYGEKLKTKYDIPFLPQKINIVSYLGETSNTYVCFIQYKQNMEATMALLPKNGVLTDFLLEDYRNVNIDFSRYNRLSQAKDVNRVIKSEQEEGIKFLVSRKKCILADGQGYGKTLELSVAAIEGNYDAILIICPASLKTNWKKELMWYVPEKDITIIDGFQGKTKGELETFLGYKEGKSNLTRDELLEEAKINGKWQHNRFVIVNYDILDEFYKIKSARSNPNMDESPMYDYIKDKKSLIIVDEAHKLSNSKSNTYKVIKSLINKGKPEGIFLATGTLITNNPKNLYSILSLLSHPVTSDYTYYMERYCDCKYICQEKEKRQSITNDFLARKHKMSWYDLDDKEKKELDAEVKRKCKHILVSNGASNLEELQERISNVYIRRITKDLGCLPNKFVKERLYEMTMEEQMEYDALWDNYQAQWEEEKAIALENYRSDLEQYKIEPAAFNFKEPEEPNLTLMKDLLEKGIYRRYLSNIMVSRTKIFVDKILEHNEKVIIACCFDEELNTLKEYYGDKCVVYNGKMLAKQKDKAKEAFMTDDNVKVFIGNLDSAGVGLTLTVARFLVFNDFDYVFANNSQMEDRIYRIGQTRDCYIYYQLFKGTEYERMYNIFRNKEAITNAVIKKEDEK